MNEATASPNMEAKCPACGNPLPSGGLAGLCPACLLQQAAVETATQPEAVPFQAPSVAEVAAMFPQLEIRSLLGKGGMGAVYQARQPGLDRLVALKILPGQAATGTDFADRFNREARALAKLNHPNIVTVHEFGQVNGMPYFIMEYVDGLNLRQLEQAGKLSPREALQIVPQICAALQFAHDAGIVHRDIKPDNILLDKLGRVKIADFGIAKLVGAPADTAVPETQGAIGTPNYMAPEQVEKPQSVDHRADIFSLGVVFYEMLTGELPLGKFGPPSSGPRGMRVDVRLDEVVLRALEKEPDRRYQHASQVKTAVETIASTQPGGPPPPIAPGIAAGAPPDPGEVPADLLARDYSLNIGHCLSRGWALLKAHFWPLVGITALMMLLIGIADSILVRVSSFRSDYGQENHDNTSLLGLLLTGPLFAGLFLYFLKTMRGEKVTVETAFAGFGARFLHLFLVHLVACFLIGLGFVCFVIPGIYLLVAWCFALVLAMDKGLDFWPAMELSRKMVNKHWWSLLGCLLVLGLVVAAGLMACGLGVFITIPLAIAAFLYAYEDIFGRRLAPGAPVAPPPVARAEAPQPAAPQPAVAPQAAAPQAAGWKAAAGGIPPAKVSLAAEPSGPAGPTGPAGTVVFPTPPQPAVPRPAPVARKGWPGWKILLVLVILGGLLLAITTAGLFRWSRFGFGSWEIILALSALILPFLLIAVLVMVWTWLRPQPALVEPSQPAPRSPWGTLGKISLVLVALLLMVALLSEMVFGVVNYRFHRANRVFQVYASSPGWPAIPAPSHAPAAPAAPTEPTPPAEPAEPAEPANSPAPLTPALDGLVDRTRQELDKAGIRFDQLQVTAAGAAQLFISLTGLQARQPGGGANDWVNLVGLLQGSPGATGGWTFTGQGQLATVHFDLAPFDLKQVLAEAAQRSATPHGSHESLVERLEAAATISDLDKKDTALSGLVKEAAAMGDTQLTTDALSQMMNMENRDRTTQVAAKLLAARGQRKKALELVKGMADVELRDRALAELAE